MFASASLLDFVAPILAAVTFWQVVKVIGIIILVIIVGWILNEIGWLVPFLNLLQGLWYLYLFGGLAIALILAFYKTFGLGWTIVSVAALLLIIGIISRIVSVRKQRKQASERQNAASAEQMRAVWEEMLRRGYCIKCGTNNTTANSYAHSLTCHDCGMVWNLPN